ncbi:hypothetical protein HZB96_03220, partial [Candidatus Gottesmanbacteria bacterium]|nr:hypothetical protein [Candidatus Gottesmanbacteria bacterium]
IIKAFVVLKEGVKRQLHLEGGPTSSAEALTLSGEGRMDSFQVKESEKLKQELSLFVKKHLAGHAYPREIEFIDKLPKTRSGKIMRRILKAKELGLPIGDTSTLEEY